MKPLRVLFLALLPIALTFAMLPTHVDADLPFLRQSGSLANPGDKVVITGLTGQSSCVFYETGTPSATDIFGSPDSSTLTTNLTPITATDFANPPSAQAIPFTPTAGQAYQFGPTSLAQIQIVADASWSGTASVSIACSSSVARAGSSGGGGSVTGVEPIFTSAPNQLSFDYLFNGVWRATQTFNAGNAAPCATALPAPGTIYDAGGDGVYLYWTESAGPFHMGAFGAGCSLSDALTIASNSAIGLPLIESNTGDGLLCLTGGVISSNTNCPSSGGQAYTPGPNITFGPSPTPSGPVPIMLASVPQVSNISVPHAVGSPSGLAGYADDGLGDGRSILVTSATSPCPAATPPAGCVVSVTGTGSVSCTGLNNVTCVGATPSPAATGCGTITGSYPYTFNTTGCQPSPIPTMYPTPIVTTSPTAAPNPISVTSQLVAGAVVYDLAFGVVEPFNGGLGLNATTFSNGQCPAYSTSLGHFTAASCGGTYLAGNGLMLTSNTFALANQIAISAAGADITVGSNGTGPGVAAWLNSQQAPTGCAAGSSLVYAAQVCVDGSGNPQLVLSRGGHDCILDLASGPAPSLSCDVALGISASTFSGAVTFSSTAAVSGFTATTNVCANASKQLYSCSSGQATCTLSSQTTCIASASIASISGLHCVATMDSASGAAAPYYAPVVSIPLVGTINIAGYVPTAESGTLIFDYKC